MAADWYKKKHKYRAELELVMDSDSDSGTLVRDEPISFSQNMRQHLFRMVRHDICGCKIDENSETSTDIDPFDMLRGE